MNDIMGFALLSLGTGALYALVAAGVVVIARGAGVLNLAQGALVAWAAYTFHGLHGPWGLPLGLAAVLAVASTAGIGVGFQLLVMRPLREATALLRLMATLGLLIIVQSSLTLMFAGAVRTSPTVLPTGTVELFGESVGADVFVRLAAVAVLVAAAWAVFRFTTVGLAATAATENPRAAATFGWSVDAIAAGAWGAGAALAGLGGVLLAPLQNPLSSTNLLLLIVPALAVALVARFSSFPGVLLGGLVLGVIEVEAQYEFVAHHPWWRGVDRAVPLAVIVFYLAVRGRGLPERGHLAERHPVLGSGRVHPRALAVTVAAALVAIWSLPRDWVDALDANALWALIILSVVVLVGFTGQLSLAQLAFSGIAALIAGRLVATRGWPLEAAMAVGVAGTAVVGLLFALPALRTRGLQLAVVTLGLGAAVDALLFQRGYHSPPPPGAGALGSLFGDLASPEGTVVGRQRFLGVPLDKVTDPRGFATVSVLAFVLVALAVANLRRGRAGRRLIAVRTNERAAAALGISVVAAKLYAFALSAAIAGFGGVLYAFYVYGERGNIDYGGGTFAPFSSILLIAYAVVGGVGWVSGSFAGATMAAGALATRIGGWAGDWLVRLGALLRVVVATIAGAGGLAVGAAVAGDRRTGGRLGVAARRWLPWLAAAVAAVLAAAFGGAVRGWLAELDRYVPLIGGIVLVVVLSRSGGGMAPENARTARLLYDRYVPGGADRRRRADAARLDQALRAAEGGSARAVVPAALSVWGLTVSFGAVRAVRAVDLRVLPGQVVGMIGPNGAGKTTVIDAITGYTPALVASMTLGEVRLDRLPAHRRARAGISRSFQNLELFDDLTVLENIQAASDRRDARAYLTDLVFPRSRPLSGAAIAAVEAFGLREDLLRTVSDLPYGRRRLLAIARAVAAGPAVLLLDEPCAGLDESASAEVAALLRRLADEWGLGILLNEHDMDVIMGVCDRVVVLDAGELIAEGTPAQVAADPRVRAAYLGDADESAHRPVYLPLS
ncbi:ATP-binding cassette domain-containing protein [Frankia sp. QA3]|uniref:ABC transporter permease subunit n=1 Tax=Frankia sp. QA3 TaxID=710111 RepID=UPI000269CD18|nr:ATP-binding cassette domain-containing protein [Frankia sp. QA3]EIV96082.1 ABC-type branched-chain amino acid transport system, ATPase component [Frankia sp. QA3]